VFADVAQGEHHAFLHALEAAHVDMGIRIGQQRCKVGGPFAHRVLHIVARLARRAREREVDVDEVLRQVPWNLPLARRRRRHSVIARIGALPVPVQIITMCERG
jgi:hypothetical protein